MTARKPGDFFFTSHGNNGGLTIRQHARLVQEWMAIFALNPAKFCMHFLRRTMATLTYRRTGNPRAAQLMPGNSRSKPLSDTWASKSMMQSRLLRRSKFDA